MKASVGAAISAKDRCSLKYATLGHVQNGKLETGVTVPSVAAKALNLEMSCAAQEMISAVLLQSLKQ